MISGLVSLCCDALVSQWEKGRFLCVVYPLYTLVWNTGATSMTVLLVNHVFQPKLTSPLHTWPDTDFLLATVAVDGDIDFWILNIEYAMSEWLTWHETHECQDDCSTLTWKRSHLEGNEQMATILNVIKWPVCFEIFVCIGFDHDHLQVKINHLHFN